MESVGRFAPSPSGRLHLGNLLCALLVWLSARQKDGRVLLRVEDLDTARCPRRYSEQMERDLQWLGLDWDIGPGRDNGTGPYYQSQRTEIYQAALETLREKGLVLHRPYVGRYACSMEMQGMSLSLMKLDDELKRLLDAPADSPFFKQF